MKKQVDDPGGPVSPAARKKTKHSAESRRRGEEKEAKGGGSTSRDARKTTVRREGGESWSSWIYQGSVQGKFARRYQKTCRLVLQEYCQGVIRTDALGEGDVSRRDAHANSRGPRRVVRHDLYSILDARYRGDAKGK